MPTNVTINQPTGAGSGVLSKSRRDIWMGREVQLVAQGGVKYRWRFTYVPPEWEAPLDLVDTESTFSFTPLGWGTWRVELVTDDGAITCYVLVSTTKDSSGSIVNYGLRRPAYGERAEEMNWDGNISGITQDYDALLQRAVDTADAVVAAAGGNTIIYSPDATPASNVYNSFSEAVTAARALPGEVWVIIDGTETPPEIDGNNNLEKRIRLRGIHTAPGSYQYPITVRVLEGAHIANAVYVEGLMFTEELTSSLFTTTEGPQDITFRKCVRAVTPDGAEFISLGAGDNKLEMYQTIFFTDTEYLCTVTGTNNLEVYLREGSVMGPDCIGGTAGDLVFRRDGSSVGTHDNFSGTVTTRDATTRSHIYPGICGSVDSDPSDGTGWTTVGTIRVDPTILADPDWSVKYWEFHADLEVMEASAGTVQAGIRLFDASNTDFGGMQSTLGAATTFPQHVQVSIDAGTGSGEVQPTATTYLIQIQRVGGSVGDVVTVHNAYIMAYWRLR